MPIYDYEHQTKPCRLGRIFEYEQSINDDKLTVCPDCNGPVQRLISRTAINLGHAGGHGLKNRSKKRGRGLGVNLIGDSKK